jgi:hypothetical protein
MFYNVQAVQSRYPGSFLEDRVAGYEYMTGSYFSCHSDRRTQLASIAGSQKFILLPNTRAQLELRDVHDIRSEYDAISALTDLPGRPVSFICLRNCMISTTHAKFPTLMRPARGRTRTTTHKSLRSIIGANA